MDAKRKDWTIVAVCALVFAGVNAALFFSGHFPVRRGGLPDWTATAGLIAAAAITFAMYSFLYKDNPFFRAAENLFVGLGLGVTFYINDKYKDEFGMLTIPWPKIGLSWYF